MTSQNPVQENTAPPPGRVSSATPGRATASAARRRRPARSRAIAAMSAATMTG